MSNRQKLFTTLKTQRKNFVGPKQLFGIQVPEMCVGSLVAGKLPEDGTLVLKDIRVGIKCGVCFIMYIIVFYNVYYCILISAFHWFKIMEGWGEFMFIIWLTQTWFTHQFSTLFPFMLSWSLLDPVSESFK